jgi:hypothetical protein
MKSYLLLLLIGILVSGCSKDEDQKAGTLPLITINSPQDGATISSGQSVLIDASVQVHQERTLTSLEVSVRAYGLTFYNETLSNKDFPEPINGKYSISETVEVADTQGFGGNATIRIVATDSAGEKDAEELSIEVR